MKLDFSKGRITLVLAPVDMRSGYPSLSGIARRHLGLNVEEGNDFVVFLSRRRLICKIIWCDAHGSAVLTRRLKFGAFQKFLEEASSPDRREFSHRDLEHFLDGETLQIERSARIKSVAKCN